MKAVVKENQLQKESIWAGRAKQVEKLCVLGAVDREIADFYDMPEREFYRQKLADEHLAQALKTGKEHADSRVERSLFQRAVGFYYTEQQAFKIKTGRDEEAVEVVNVERYQVADTTAQIFWLKNRKRLEWTQTGELNDPQANSTNVTINLAGKSDRELALAALAQLGAAPASPEPKVIEGAVDGSETDKPRVLPARARRISKEPDQAQGMATRPARNAGRGRAGKRQVAGKG